MEDNIYKEEFIREQARIDARKGAEPQPKRKSQLLRYAAPAMFTGLLAYTVYIIGSEIGFSPMAFLELDFIIAAGVLTGLFLWARTS